MLIVHDSTKNFVDNPNGYFIKAKWKQENWVISAEKKNLINRIKAFLSGYFDNIFGHYKLENVCNYITHLDAIPEHTPLKQAVNKVIAKYHQAMRRKPYASIFPFDTYKVEVRSNVELTREKIVDLVHKAFPDGYKGWKPVPREDGKYDLKHTDIKADLIEYIEARCDEGLLAHPDLYMNRWIRIRGGTHEDRVIEDGALRFFRNHVFTISG